MNGPELWDREQGLKIGKERFGNRKNEKEEEKKKEEMENASCECGHSSGDHQHDTGAACDDCNCSGYKRED